MDHTAAQNPDVIELIKARTVSIFTTTAKMSDMIVYDYNNVFAAINLFSPHPSGLNNLGLTTPTIDISDPAAHDINAVHDVIFTVKPGVKIENHGRVIITTESPNFKFTGICKSENVNHICEVGKKNIKKYFYKLIFLRYTK